jgi:hypothetical protein
VVISLMTPEYLDSIVNSTSLRSKVLDNEGHIVNTIL